MLICFELISLPAAGARRDVDILKPLLMIYSAPSVVYLLSKRMKGANAERRQQLGAVYDLIFQAICPSS
jgi:hypothetical protein